MGHTDGPEWTLTRDGHIELPDGRLRAVYEIDPDSKQLLTLLEMQPRQAVMQIVTSCKPHQPPRQFLVAMPERGDDREPGQSKSPVSKNFLRTIGKWWQRAGVGVSINDVQCSNLYVLGPNEQSQRLDMQDMQIQHALGAPALNAQQLYDVLQQMYPTTAYARAQAHEKLQQKRGVLDPVCFAWSAQSMGTDGLDLGAQYFAGHSVMLWPESVEPGAVTASLQAIANEHEVDLQLSTFIYTPEPIIVIEQMRHTAARTEARLENMRAKSTDEQLALDTTYHLLSERTREAKSIIERLERCETLPLQLAAHLGISGEVWPVRAASKMLTADSAFRRTHAERYRATPEMRSANTRHAESRIATLPVGVHAMADAFSARFVVGEAVAAVLASR